MDDLARQLARTARHLGLDTATVADADAETLRDFANFVLQELAARGLIAGPENIGCWAMPRITSN